jgi:hypothetical protein
MALPSTASTKFRPASREREGPDRSRSGPLLFPEAELAPSWLNPHVAMTTTDYCVRWPQRDKNRLGDDMASEHMDTAIRELADGVAFRRTHPGGLPISATQITRSGLGKTQAGILLWPGGSSISYRD